MDKNIDSLEGDGFLFHLFHLLWLKDPVLGFVPTINVPDTILFKYDQPFTWYFVKNRIMKRKSKSKLNIDEIKRNFLKNIPKSGIVALYVTQYSLNEINDKVIYEYFNAEELIKFLYEKQTAPREGVLQKFIQPKTEHNFIIRAIWGPTICLFEKIENINNINDTKQDIYQRVLTFESGNSPTRTVPVRGYILPHRLENFVYNIVQHVSNVTFDRIRIKRMIFNFKIDEQERIWFLFCSSIRLENPSSVLHKYYGEKLSIYNYDNPNIKIEIPKNIEEIKLSYPKPLDLRRNFKCLNCDKRTDSHGIFKIKYRDIINGWDFDHFNKKDLVELASLSPRLRTHKDIEKKNDKNDILNVMISKKTHTSKKNVDFVYRCLFNDDERESYYNTFTIFSNQQKSENTNNLIEIPKNYNIPLIIKKLHPHMKEKEFFKLSKNPGFLDKIALVCEDCYLIIIGSSNVPESLKQITKKNNRESHFLGKGRLNPEQTIHRFNLTREKIINESNNDCFIQKQILKTEASDIKSKHNIHTDSNILISKDNKFELHLEPIFKNKRNSNYEKNNLNSLLKKKNYLNFTENTFEKSGINSYHKTIKCSSIEKTSTFDSNFSKESIESKTSDKIIIPKQNYLKGLEKKIIQKFVNNTKKSN